MAKERVQRRLSAILAADVVGYSRLIEADEQGTRRLAQPHDVGLSVKAHATGYGHDGANRRYCREPLYEHGQPTDQNSIDRAPPMARQKKPTIANLSALEGNPSRPSNARY